MSAPMPPDSPAWSTPKFLLIAFVVSFVLIFALNGILNELLELGIPSGAFGAAVGVATAALLPRWKVARAFLQRRA